MDSQQQPDSVPERTIEEIERLVREQLEGIKKDSVRSEIEKLLVPPSRHMRNWDYGQKGQQFPCWTVARDSERGIDYLYSYLGFGPEHPWGHASTDDPWFGMDSKWHGSLGDVHLDSLQVGTLFTLFATVTGSSVRYSGAARAAIFILPMVLVAALPLGVLMLYIGAARGSEPAPFLGLPFNFAFTGCWWLVMTVLLFATRAVAGRDHSLGWKAKWAAKTCAVVAVVLLVGLCVAWYFASDKL